MQIIVWLTLVCMVASMQLSQSKNITVLNGSYYSTSVNISKVNSEYTPSKVQIAYFIGNMIPSSNEYFDVFYYMDSADKLCYQSVIGNESYLRTCSFLQNNFSQLRQVSFSRSFVNQSNIDKVNNAAFYMIVDNTPYPYPKGAYENINITLHETSIIDIDLSGVYEQVGIRLIYMNCTIYLIFGVVISILYYKHRKNLKAIKDFDEPDKIQEEQMSSDDDADLEMNKSLKSHQKYSLVQKLQ